ncbi:MAG: 16S rRNA (cytosine(1402)-N(4))-methyltransferase RsmH [Candidatus Moranbacteria bacterium]|nr:16S rRNA (cytosine(1402)-N(4))-methyltransferase RsmH [Candidatus Moranbacteria bacterium]
MKETRHIPVLLNEAIAMLAIGSGNTVVDATLGGGGHLIAFCHGVVPGGKVIALDVDASALERFRNRISDNPDVQTMFEDESLVLAHGNYSDLGGVLKQQGVAFVDAIFADLGFSSDQIEDRERGFGLLQDGPLDMRLDRESEMTAAMLLHSSSVDELRHIIREYGDEEEASRIARAIIRAREERPIETTTMLREIIENVYPAAKRRKLKIHPATKTFQALRIVVNKEHEHLKMFLEESVRYLRPGGRLAVITFHSGEDRIVKHFFQELSRGCVCPLGFPVCRCGKKASLKIITKKPIIPSVDETNRNPRARSAKLRIAQKNP